MGKAKNNLLEKIEKRFKNNKVFVVIFIVFIIYFGFAKFLNSVAKISDIIDPEEPPLEIIKQDSIKPIVEDLEYMYTKYKDSKFNIAVLHASDKENLNSFVGELKRSFPNCDVESVRSWSEKKNYKVTKIVYIKTELKHFAETIERKFPKDQIVQKYYEGNPYYGLSKRDIAIFLGDDL